MTTDLIFEEAGGHIWFREYPTHKVKCKICGLERLPSTNLQVFWDQVNRMEGDKYCNGFEHLSKAAVLSLIEDYEFRGGDDE